MSSRILRATVLGALLASSIAVAHDGATGIVKQRMDAMAELGDVAKAVSDMLKGKQTFERYAVRDAARLFVRHGEMIPMLFPDTDASRSGTATEALSSVWDERAAFESSADSFVERSQELLDAFDAGADRDALQTAAQLHWFGARC